MEGGKVIARRNDIIFLRKLLRAMKDPKTKFDPSRFASEGRDYLYNYVNENVEPVNEERRTFLKGLIIGVSAVAVLGSIPRVLGYLNQPLTTLPKFPTLLLVDSNGDPVKASDTTLIPVNSPIITLFTYPMVNDPNFILRLGDAQGNEVQVPPAKVTVPATGEVYLFPGGVGPKKSIVAYSAICQHLGCRPPEIHFYPPQYVSPAQLSAADPNLLTPQALAAARAANVPAIIHCDCHGSTYDPYRGAAVLTGPTTRPLPTAELVWDPSTDYLYVTRMIGVPIFGAPNGNDLEGFPLPTMNSDYTGTTEVEATINTFR
ncbi:Rieske iron-sulfur protein SoxL2 [Sulfodiicoccus acidiphilus]|uniref:Rieske iron-sulfur protein SoxL2 n=1 Tax=Sulfodiicoccus acidiphilus TaxID=1670455 RepID=A0A348B4B1_9CREN|nr:Rieske 2Fe-2S domain-containing protein [Sulfodiicoccus acidiphilus]BBD73013.1 Rieske iron-sulfur protein SoxL2 [Sulfodiicoccus acidiphilus]GGU04518.1 Rieske iron-sulfur protein SoxL2 [Sulfodiicoccus acidiphilus]